ncbi:hypothetical protein PRZ48_006931 [Zasmidium cellare]|uniref:Amidohydrolase-related domain-containing protein n=1 Tax=Zasmidium cellare TaxID=395010 RepID=A0ABR0EHZ7_ZASCE|nr:hypothetical protein PRZ48_006931 [Zasmidium cellare]
MSTKYLIQNATIVSVDPRIGIKNNCDVSIEGEFIAAVGPGIPVSPEQIVIDGTDMIVSPGFVDTHRHAWQTQTRTIAADFVLSDYAKVLRNVFGSCYTAEDAYLGNYCAALECIDSGITSIIDHSHIMNSSQHADEVVRAWRDSNMRAIFCYGAYGNPAWTGSTLDNGRETDNPDWRYEDARRVRQSHFKDNGTNQLVRFGFATSEPEMVPIETIASQIELARDLGAAVITSHIALGKWDIGLRTVRSLESKGLLGSDLLFSHGSTLEDDELKAISQREAGLSCTPDTELQMGMGPPVGFKASDCGCKVGLGVDVCCSAPGDMFHQMRLLLQAHRHLEHEKTPGPPMKIAKKCEDALKLATQGGADAIGLGEIVGSVTPGKRADILLKRCDSPRLVPVHDPVATLVLYANASDIDTVFINGRVVKSAGKLQSVDWPSVRTRLRKSTADIHERARLAPADEIEKAMSRMTEALKVAVEKNKQRL